MSTGALGTGWVQAGFDVGGLKVLWTDLLGNICSLGTVVLAIRRTIWTWPVQLAGAALLLIASLSAQLGGNAAKQALFCVLACYGWSRWVRGRRGPGGLAVRPATRRERAGMVAVALAGTAVVAWLLNHFDASWSPLPDAYIFVGSAVATYAQGRALVDFWWVWVAVDAVGVPLALKSGLYVTGTVYGVFFVLCLIGFRDWLRTYRAGAGLARREEVVVGDGRAGA